MSSPSYPLLAQVAAGLSAHGIRFALVGASALARHGVSRATQGFDLLTADARVLTAATQIAGNEAAAEVRRGDPDDPLAGLVLFTAAGERSVDVILGRGGWQEDAVRRATPASLGDLTIPVVSVADFILLKLYAGGPQDAWDIQQLLAATDRETVIEQVDGRLNVLPSECARLWRRVITSP